MSRRLPRGAASNAAASRPWATTVTRTWSRTSSSWSTDATARSIGRDSSWQAMTTSTNGRLTQAPRAGPARRSSGPPAMSSSKLPRAAMVPSCMKQIRSLSRIVERRCATETIVTSPVQAADRGGHERLGLGVERARRLVEHEHERVAVERTRDAEPLSLPAREREPALADAAAHAACRGPTTGPTAGRARAPREPCRSRSRSPPRPARRSGRWCRRTARHPGARSRRASATPRALVRVRCHRA